MKATIKNVSGGKLVFGAGFSLAPGQSREVTEEDTKAFNKDVVSAWENDGLIEIDGPVESASDEEAEAKRKADEEVEAKRKADEEAEAKRKADEKTKAPQMPGANQGGKK